MRHLDWPPVWLIATLLVAWLDPFRMDFGAVRWLGYLLLWTAAGIVIAALIEFRRARTTIIPHESPSALITSGIFRFSRNPIYLADLLVLAGLSLHWGSVVGLLLVPVLLYILQSRFIQGEEARLSDAFPDAFTSYVARTRRWL